MSAMKRRTTLRLIRYGLAMSGFVLLAACMRLTPLPPAQSAVDMFSIYDGHPSTAAEREQALNDCTSYGNSLGISGPMDVGNQICMLQLGFRAPGGEIVGLMTSNIQGSGEGCAGEPGDPVCWAVKYGWPQDPPPRWAKPGVDPDNLGNVWYACYSRYLHISAYPALFIPKVDQCMTQRYGYTVVHPHSPTEPWLPHKYWPDCKKPEAEMNWLEKKWCPPGP